ncbi:MAG: PDZ domain-containing protein [Chthoniobacter sp.]|nr:PDZ domain-containing protein [Chthoniobacter sp.]
MKFSFLLVVVSFAVVSAFAQDAGPGPINARLMQMPAVSQTQIAFIYAGDIWIAPKTGGAAVRLSSPRGAESFPRFSPDGTQLAFSGNYDGNGDVYVMPVTGGEPRRITHHGASDRVLGWYPDGKALLFASQMLSFTERASQLFKVSSAGGMPEKLPVPYGEFGAISPDGKLLAYTPISTDFATWKRYRGGMAPDVWIFDLEKKTAENITHNDANDSQPMWHGTTVYFLSDRNGQSRANLWAYDARTKQTRPVTKFADSDVRFPSMGPEEIVFESHGHLHLLDLASERVREVEITLVTDRATLRPRTQNVAALVRNGAISPTGKRALFEARGEIFSVPAEQGIVRNLTASSGVAERYPAWSPDGKWIAYFSDRTGEYELTLLPADGKGAEQVQTQLGAGWRYQPQWSPDAKKIVFIDSAMRVHLHDVATKITEVIDQAQSFYHGELERFTVSWSADSRWLAYARDQENDQTAIVLYDTQEKKRQQVTSGFHDDDLPVFDPDGKYLYYRSKRIFEPLYSDSDRTWIYANGESLMAVPLRRDVASPLAPRDDEEPGGKTEGGGRKAEDKPAEEPKPGEKKDEPNKDEEKKSEVALKEAKTAEEGKPAEARAGDKTAKAEERKSKPVRIDIEGFEARAVVLPVGGGRFDNLLAVPGKVIFRWPPRIGARAGASPLSYWDLEKREEKQIIDDCNGVELSADGKKLLLKKGTAWGIVNVADAQKLDKPLAMGGLEMTVEPAAEWRQIFNDAWRMERDFFYDPGMHGLDWKAMRERYGKMLDDAVTRWDVNYLLGEMLGELNVSHAYRGGGDVEEAGVRGVGYLGCDFALDQGAYRITRILETAVWDTLRSPLRQPGVKVAAGDWLLAVNGRALDVREDPWTAFQGLADRTVLLTVNNKPNREGARDLLVQTLASEAGLRQQAWIEANRQRVDTASGGKIGYVYVRNTAADGQSNLYQQFRAQFAKPGLIIDERWNSGGQIPDRFIELLGRRVTNYWAVRDGRDWQTPHVAHRGPKAMLANGWSGSGGDCFPWLFRKNELGPVIGQRTWGGLIGMTGTPLLIDGGHVTVPTFSIYDTTGEWIIEGHGVDPDIAVVDDPAELAKGVDPQLERAIAEVQKSVETKPPQTPKKPAYPNRAPRGESAPATP